MATPRCTGGPAGETVCVNRCGRQDGRLAEPTHLRRSALTRRGGLDAACPAHYIGRMIASLRETKTRLSELIGLAEKGEDVLITVRGKPKARIVGVRPVPKSDLASWKTELESLHAQCATGKSRITAEQVLMELREERG